MPLSQVVHALPADSPVLPPSMRSSESALGRVYYAEQFWPLEHRHGKYALEQAFDLDEVARRRLDDALTIEHIRDAAFIDIETTGLSGGTGSYAFLVGIGSFEGLAFRLRQFFLAEPSSERAMLAAIAETIERKTLLVSFNGRSFDVPQLLTRYALHRLECFEDTKHLDLLLAARRLYGKRLESCRLGTVERSLLGLDRETDIPSWLIPSLYFSYMHRGRAQALHPVFLHNALDILSLVTFLAHLGKQAGASAGFHGGAEHLVALGRWDESKGQPSQAAQIYEAVLARDHQSEAAGEAAARLAGIHRRDGIWQESERIWTAEIDVAGSPLRLISACIELAKISEHRRGNHEEALAFTLRAMEALGSLRRHERPLKPTVAEMEQRLARLRGKLQRRARTTRLATSQ